MGPEEKIQDGLKQELTTDEHRWTQINNAKWISASIRVHRWLTFNRVTTANLPTSPSLADLRRGLLARLEQFRGKVRKHLVLEGLARWLAELVGIALLSFILDRLLRLSLPMRFTFLAIGGAFLIVEAWRFIISPLFIK